MYSTVVGMAVCVSGQQTLQYVFLSNLFCEDYIVDSVWANGNAKCDTTYTKRAFGEIILYNL